MPYPQNFPSFSDLGSWPVGDIAALPADALADFQNEADELLQAAKAGKARIDDALTLRYADASAESRRAAGKDTGTVRLQDGPVTVVADLTQIINIIQRNMIDYVI